jgi:hypothetical protein
VSQAFRNVPHVLRNVPQISRHVPERLGNGIPFPGMQIPDLGARASNIQARAWKKGERNTIPGDADYRPRGKWSKHPGTCRKQWGTEYHVRGCGYLTSGNIPEISSHAPETVENVTLSWLLGFPIPENRLQILGYRYPFSEQ